VIVLTRRDDSPSIIWCEAVKPYEPDYGRSNGCENVKRKLMHRGDSVENSADISEPQDPTHE